MLTTAMRGPYFPVITQAPVGSCAWRPGSAPSPACAAGPGCLAFVERAKSHGKPCAVDKCRGTAPRSSDLAQASHAPPADGRLSCVSSAGRAWVEGGGQVRRLLLVLVLGGLAVLAPSGPSAAEPRPGFGWPLAGTPRVDRAFTPPRTAYGAGHQGVDLSGVASEPVLAAGPGQVTYAGLLAGRGVVTVTHTGGPRTTDEPVTEVRPRRPGRVPGDRPRAAGGRARLVPH